MSRGERIIVAMSGGVDSAVAAARLVDEGFDVVGVTLHLWDYPEATDCESAKGRCCAPEDQYDAARTAEALAIPHYSFDRRAEFHARVVAPFVDAYAAGETPSPCTACNRSVKLGELASIADRLGAARIATGHYARVGASPSGAACIYAGVDRQKDQSYFLYATPHALVRRLAFPLGESTKAEVRGEAVARNIPGATKGESQELCFVGAGAHAYVEFVEERMAPEKRRPGPILDQEGRRVGTHDGVHRFTVGQRKGLGVALGHPAFVSSIDAESGAVRVGRAEDLEVLEAEVDDLVLAAGEALPLAATVRVRYRHEGAPGTVLAEGGAVRVRFDRPVRGVARGQVAVFYDGDRVLGGARIRATTRAGASTLGPLASPRPLGAL